MPILNPTAFYQPRSALDPTSFIATAWNPSDKDTQIVLSNADLTATGALGSVSLGKVRAIRGQTSGQFYYEVTLNLIGSNDVVGIGVARSTSTLTSSVGVDANSVGSYVWGGAIQIGGVTVKTGPTSNTNGQIFGIATDLTNKKIWFKNITTASNWNATIGDDPATNTGGVDITSIVSGTLYPAVSPNVNNRQVTANFGGSAYTGTPPSGFGNW